MNGHFDIGAITPTKYFFSIAIVLGLLFAMISVDSEKSAILVFLQWQLQTVLPMALLIGMHLSLSNSSRFASLNPWLGLSLSGALGATLFAPAALLIDIWLEPAPPASLTAGLLDEWLSVLPPITICWLALNAPWILGFRLERREPRDDERRSVGETGDASDDPQQLPDAEFMELLPEDKKGRLILLKSELHYLQVVTEHGSSLILYNLGDAIKQLPRGLGIPVHRSYWVARDAVQQLVRHGRQGELRLHSGHRVPISRNRMQSVTEAFAELEQQD